MSCIDETKAEKIARRKALGRIGALRRSIKTFKARVGEDWLFGFVKTRVREDGFQISVKLAYVDCRGVALEKLPPSVMEKIRQYVEEAAAALLQREFSDLLK